MANMDRYVLKDAETDTVLFHVTFRLAKKGSEEEAKAKETSAKESKAEEEHDPNDDVD
jgi:hypothetical protein